MSLTAGTRLGPYEIGVLLGQGGMGEVYRARDTRLGRDVAIKVSVERFNERFEREARAVAALNHPNICTLHDVGPNYLVMELVDGETLAEKLEEVSRLKSQGSGLPLDEALTIARQIAEAIEAAHEKAIVHRDLKPANVKITPDGLVKVLDFGLARIGAGAAGGDPATSPTLSMATGAGVILGTAVYMSPEQARGLPADHRSDVFSFGIVLCEMLTGRRPFPGETAPDVLASVLARDPDLSALPPNLNPRIGELLRRCLDKNPKRRWQAAGDLRAEIETIAAAPRAVPPSAAVVTPRPFWKRAMPVAATAVLATALMSVVWWSFRPGTPLALAVTRFSFLLPAGQQFTSIASRLVAISPDGKEFVYVANGLVYLRSMSELEASPIPGTESLQSSYPTFSPDGRSVAFHSNRDRTLKRIAVSGGAAVTIGEDVDLPYGMSWGANGILVGQTGKGIIRVLPNGGKPELLVSIKPGEIAHGPQILPGGEAVLFTLSAAAGSEQWDNALIVVQSLASGARTTLIEGGSDARYLPTGHIVYALGGSLFAIPFDLERLQVTGGSTPVVAGVRRTARSGTAIFSVSDTGTLIYLRGPAFTSSSQRDLVLIDRKGDIEPLKVPRGAYESPRVSPDGKRVAVSTRYRQGGEHLDLRARRRQPDAPTHVRRTKSLPCLVGRWPVGGVSIGSGGRSRHLLAACRWQRRHGGTADETGPGDFTYSGILVADRSGLLVQCDHRHRCFSLDVLYPGQESLSVRRDTGLQLVEFGFFPRWALGSLYVALAWRDGGLRPAVPHAGCPVSDLKRRRPGSPSALVAGREADLLFSGSERTGCRERHHGTALHLRQSRANSWRIRLQCQHDQPEEPRHHT